MLEPRSSRQDPRRVHAACCSRTRSLEENFPINLVVLGLDGRPGRKNIREMLDEWVGVPLRDRHAAHEASGSAQVDRRIHILEGRSIVFLNIDKVIRIIRKSDEPKPDADEAIQLTDIQAEDILEIRLRQLARLEGIKIQNELKALKTERKELKASARQRQPRCASSSSRRSGTTRRNTATTRRTIDRGSRPRRRSSARSSTSRSRSSCRATAGCARARATALDLDAAHLQDRRCAVCRSSRRARSIRSR